jgi:hypothetical protein
VPEHVSDNDCSLLHLLCACEQSTELDADFTVRGALLTRTSSCNCAGLTVLQGVLVRTMLRIVLWPARSRHFQCAAHDAARSMHDAATRAASPVMFACSLFCYLQFCSWSPGHQVTLGGSQSSLKDQAFFSIGPFPLSAMALSHQLLFLPSLLDDSSLSACSNQLKLVSCSPHNYHSTPAASA